MRVIPRANFMQKNAPKKFPLVPHPGSTEITPVKSSRLYRNLLGDRFRVTPVMPVVFTTRQMNA